MHSHELMLIAAPLRKNYLIHGEVRSCLSKVAEITIEIL
jgi:hypothetical protein